MNQQPNDKGMRPNPKPQDLPASHSETPQGNLGFSVVGIGASAGGLEALQEFFQNTPDEPGVAFVVVQHLSPDYKSLMDELLARYTPMKIHRVRDGLKVQVNHIYLIPPRKNMTLYHGKLYLEEQNTVQRINMPIDIFMRSLAKDQGKNAIGIVLSGTGSDGTLGIRSIKEHGGMVIAQDDQSAKFDGMPKSSISTGVVDYILTPKEMPEALINYVKHPFIQKTQKIEKQISEKGNYLQTILHIINEVTGTDFTNYKESTIIRRLEKRISINRYNSLEEYINFLRHSTREANILYKELLIGVTRFFRDKEAFNKLQELVFPGLFAHSKEDQPLRVWSIGCSTGEEAYSLAILLAEYMETHNIDKEVKLFATDIDKDSIEYAGSGQYPASIVTDISEEYLKKYFTRKSEGYQVNESIRRMVVFAAHNVLKDPPFSKLNLVVCRNMLIYLNNDMQGRVLSMFYYSLLDNGYLFLGSSESVGEASKGFDLLDSKSKIYKYQPGYHPDMNETFRLPGLVSRKHTVAHEKPRRKKGMHQLEGIFDELINVYFPPTVIVDENYHLVHTLKNVNTFLTLPVGRVDLNVLHMLPDKLNAMVSNLLRQARKKNRPITETVRFPQLDDKQVKIFCQMLEDQVTKELFFIISFELLEKPASGNKQPPNEKETLSQQYQERIHELEQELQYTKENLQATVEELETSNEELQSSNEELIASNEELQSTNEELQSVNEELYTVNAEHQNKIEELTSLHNDVNNLLKNTQIGTLFIDSRLRIRKLTEIASNITYIRETDLNRPIDHIELKHVYPQFIDDIKQVIDDLQPRESEVENEEGQWFLIRIVPYRTEVNAVDGIIITFVDISQRKALEVEQRKTHEFIYQTLRVNPVANTIVDSSGKLTFANKQAEELLQITQEHIARRSFDDTQWEITDINGNPIPSDDLPFCRIMRTKKPLANYEHYIKIPGHSKRLLDISGSPMLDQENEVKAVVFALNDITQQRHDEMLLKAREQKYRQLFNSNRDAILVADTERNIVDANPALEKLFGYSLNEMKGFSTQFLYAEKQTFKEVGLELQNTQEEKSQRKIVRYKKKNGDTFAGETTIFTTTDDYGQDDLFVGFIRDVTEQMNLQKRQHLWQVTIDQMQEALVIVDPNYHLIDYNQPFADLFEADTHELKGKKIFQLVHGTDHPPEDCITCKAIQNKQAINEKVWLPNQKSWFRVATEPIFGSNGQFEFLLERFTRIDEQAPDSKR